MTTTLLSGQEFIFKTSVLFAYR